MVTLVYFFLSKAHGSMTTRARAVMFITHFYAQSGGYLQLDAIHSQNAAQILGLMTWLVCN